MSSTSGLNFRLAEAVDSTSIAALVNAAYRGETSRQGWTTEVDLLEGLRTTPAEVQRLIGTPNTLILTCVRHDEIVASVCLEFDQDAVHIGMFTVHPALQGLGIGKQLLTYAESFARQHWSVNKFLMHVISVRHELIDFYERRGYLRTGKLRPFPVNPAMWQPRMSGLQLELLEKTVTI